MSARSPILPIKHHLSRLLYHILPGENAKQEGKLLNKLIKKSN